jgi:hypothetical protein
MDGMYSVNAGAINGLCGPDVLQKNSIERSVPKAEWSVVSFYNHGWLVYRKCRTQFSVRVLFADQKVPMASPSLVQHSIRYRSVKNIINDLK